MNRFKRPADATGIPMSYIAINRMIEKQLSSSQKYRQHFNEQDGVVLAYGREMTDLQLQEKLMSLGLRVGHEQLGEWSGRFLSAEELSEWLVGEHRLELDEGEGEWPWVALAVLWERWFPAVASFEMLDDAIEVGVQVVEDDPEQAIDVWNRAWQDVKQLVRRGGFTTISAFDSRFRGTDFIYNWLQDFVNLLEDEAIRLNDSPSLHQRRIELCEEILQVFPKESLLAVGFYKGSIADSYRVLGQPEKTDAIYGTLLEEHPGWGPGWLQWAGNYWPWGKDPQKAREILERSLSVEDVSERPLLLDRLEKVYREMGQDAKVASLTDKWGWQPKPGAVLLDGTPWGGSRVDDALAVGGTPGAEATNAKAGQPAGSEPGAETTDEAPVPYGPEFLADRVMRDFMEYDGTYERHSVNLALKLRDAVTPRLIALLDDIVSNYPDYLDRPDFLAPIYALLLLGHFRETKAHPLIIRLLHLPEHVVDDIFGDVFYSHMDRVLFLTCGGNVQFIKDLVADRYAGEHCRAMATSALVYAVVLGGYLRDEIVVFFRELFTGCEAEPGSSFWPNLVIDSCDLHPGELLGEIRLAFERDLVDPSWIKLEHIEQASRRGLDEVIAETRERLQKNIHADFHDYMSRWACFDPESIANSSRLRSKKEQERKKLKKQRKKAARKQRADQKKRKQKRK